MKTFSCTPIKLHMISALDLHSEIWDNDVTNRFPDASAYSITIYDTDGITPEAENAEALYLPSEGRLGIAWGADATWADVRDVESGIEMWLNDSDAWKAAN